MVATAGDASSGRLEPDQKYKYPLGVGLNKKVAIPGRRNSNTEKAMAKGEIIKAAYARGSKVRNRGMDQTGVVAIIAANDSGTWYHVTTQSGMSIGWWHETDIDGAPRTVPPSEKRKG